MATRQRSASSNRVKKPRVQIILGEAVNARLEAYAREEGRSISNAGDFIITQFFLNQRPPDESVARVFPY